MPGTLWIYQPEQVLNGRLPINEKNRVMVGELEQGAQLEGALCSVSWRVVNLNAELETKTFKSSWRVRDCLRPYPVMNRLFMRTCGCQARLQLLRGRLRGIR